MRANPEFKTSTSSSSSSRPSSGSLKSGLNLTPVLKKVDFFGQRIKILENKILKISELEEKTFKIEKNVEESEKRMRNLNRFMTAVAFAALIAFTIATVTICANFLNSNH